MRIGVNGRFCGAPVTGVQRFAREVAARLARDEEAVLLLPASTRAPAPLAGHAPVVRGRLAGHPWEQLELPYRARTAGCDVVLQPSGPGSLRGGPYVLVVHDVLPLTHPCWFGTRFTAWYRFGLRRAARRAAAVVTVSEWARGEIVRVLGVPPERVRVAPQGVAPFDRPADAAAVARVRDRFSLPERHLLAVGGGDPRKNTAFLLDVLERWRERRGRAPSLIVAGAAPARVHGRTRTGRVSSSGADVRFPGRVDDDDLHALYTSASAFCFPSLAEGFGRPPLEAMACGTPAVVAPYGPAGEVLGEAARIAPLVPDAWVDALEPLMEHGSEREQAVAVGRARASRYRWNDAAAAVLDACREAVGEARVAASSTAASNAATVRADRAGGAHGDLAGAQD